MKLFKIKKAWGRESINFVDQNNVLIGFDFSHHCGESFGAILTYEELPANKETFHMLAQHCITINKGQCDWYNGYIVGRKARNEELLDIFEEDGNVTYEEYEKQLETELDNWEKENAIQWYNNTGEINIDFNPYYFDVNYLQVFEDYGEKYKFPNGGMIVAKFVCPNRPDVFLCLWNSHNGFYHHDLEFKNFNSTKIIEAI